MVLRIAADRCFQVGSARLLPEGERLIASLVAVLKELPATRVQLAVHTDLVRPESIRHAGSSTAAPPSEDAWALSERQGLSLLRAATAAGLDPSRASVTSYGGFRPISSSDTPEDRAKNRRVELQLSPMD
jgi:chemotaxis protein MotB